MWFIYLQNLWLNRGKILGLSGSINVVRMKNIMSIAQYKSAAKKKKPRKKSRDLEHKLQVACVTWFRTQSRKFDMLLFSLLKGVY